MPYDDIIAATGDPDGFRTAAAGALAWTRRWNRVLDDTARARGAAG